MKIALFWKPLKNGFVKCELCPRFCKIPVGKFGVCKARKNIDGKLYSMVYGKVAAYNIDPIEKKPFFHFAPGSQSLSFSTTGCNLRCKFCQNWQISMSEPKGSDVEPEQIVQAAVRESIQGIAYTYTEPTVFYEFALDTMKIAKKEGLYNVWVSNGFTNPEPIKKIARYLHAINVDVKGDMPFYQKLCGVKDEKPVRKALRLYRSCGVWIEITNLIIPSYNDKDEQIEKIVRWVKRYLGIDTPIHFTRFYPYYKLTNIKPTPIGTLERAYEIAKKIGMRWVYIGNVPGHKYESTYCWKCGELLIQRIGYELSLYSEKCPVCGEKVKIAGKKWKGVIEV